MKFVANPLKIKQAAGRTQSGGDDARTLDANVQSVSPPATQATPAADTAPPIAPPDSPPAAPAATPPSAPDAPDVKTPLEIAELEDSLSGSLDTLIKEGVVSADVAAGLRKRIKKTVTELTQEAEAAQEAAAAAEAATGIPPVAVIAQEGTPST